MFSSIGKLALDDAPVAVYWLNNCGEIVYSNKVFAKMIGYSTEELSRMNICEISSNFTHSQWEAYWNRLKKSGTNMRLATLLLKSGYKVQASINDSYLKYSGMDYNCAFLKNLDSEQETQGKLIKQQSYLKELLKQKTAELDTFSKLVRSLTEKQTITEKALHDSEQKFRTIFNKARDAIILWEWDAHKVGFKVIEVNDMACQRFEYTRQEMVGKYADSFQPNSKESKAKFLAGTKATIHREDGATYELLHKSKSGKILQNEVSGLRFELNGKLVILSIIRDISSRKEYEMKLKNMYEREKMLNTQLENEFKKRAEFTRILVHELKTPLTPIIAASDMLVKMLPYDDLHELANQINKGAEELENRMNDLFDLVRGELGILSLNIEKIDCVKLLLDIVEYIHPQAQAKNQNLETVFQPNLPLIEVDQVRFKQIVMNILENSLKFTPQGGFIKIGVSQRGRHLVVCIKDNGSGIPKVKQKRLLTSYDDRLTSKESSGGLGLGLALSKTFVDLHHGQITISSQEGHGTTCDIILPVKQTDVS
ncbi:ATP-binding protein [Dehalococcoides mccartyi]|uniref:sensor histidine kinase n=1 Tax=Dehalococcoides mccartyi TaxID=61435 RepID=UPI0002B76E44|nr:ATP-binding protein [Dehalococcoides mccartyi]AGG05754.1 PAS domain signal transduction histidine kinase [Dehalococcoides mccartyi DCMB5]